MAYRLGRRRRIREIPNAELAEAGADRTTPVSPDGRRLAAALTELDADQRALLALHHLEGRSLAEIGLTLGIPVGTVKSRLFAARRALDAALAGEDER